MKNIVRSMSWHIVSKKKKNALGACPLLVLHYYSFFFADGLTLLDKDILGTVYVVTPLCFTTPNKGLWTSSNPGSKEKQMPPGRTLIFQIPPPPLRNQWCYFLRLVWFTSITWCKRTSLSYSTKNSFRPQKSST